MAQLCSKGVSIVPSTKKRPKDHQRTTAYSAHNATRKENLTTTSTRLTGKARTCIWITLSSSYPYFQAILRDGDHNDCCCWRWNSKSVKEKHS